MQTTDTAPRLVDLLERLTDAGTDADLHLQVARAFASHGHAPGALAHFSRALALADGRPLEGRPEAAGAVLACLQAAGRHADVVSLAQRELAVTPSPHLFTLLGRSHLALGHLTRAELAFRQALSTAGEEGEARAGALWGLSEALLRLCRVDEAERVCDDILSVEPYRADARVRAAWCALVAGRAGADHTVRRLRAASGVLNPEAQDLLGRNPGEVVRSDDVDVADAAFCVATAAGDYRTAEAALLEAADRLADAESLWRRALCRLELGEYRGAAEDLWAVLALRREDPAVARTLGRCHEALGDGEDAAAAYRHAAGLDGADREAWLGLARSELALDGAQEATAAAEQALALAAEDVEAALLLGRAHRAAGRLQEAYETLAALLNGHPERRDVRVALLDVLLDAEEFELAAAVANEALEAAAERGLEPEDAPLCRGLGAALLKLDRPKEAHQAREVAARLDPRPGDQVG